MVFMHNIVGARAGIITDSLSRNDGAESAQQLTEAVTKAQAQIDASQRQILQLQQELMGLQEQIAKQKTLPSQPAETTTTADAVAKLTKDVEDLHERQAMQQSQIATLDQSKVESESKYSVKLSGLILANGFVNTHRVDIAADPTYALYGPGTTGLSLRQTILGVDARGPHLFGATTHGDVHADFFGASTQMSYDTGGLLRLRTAHAEMNWKDTKVFVELDRTILVPNAPSSLTAVAEPPLAWAGNLWSWNPQLGISHEIDLGGHEAHQSTGSTDRRSGSSYTGCGLHGIYPERKSRGTEQMARHRSTSGLRIRCGWLRSGDWIRRIF